MTHPSAVPVGWYADPAGLPQHRWWDGTTWTDTVASYQPTAPAGETVPAPAPSVEPVASAVSQPTTEQPAWQARESVASLTPAAVEKQQGTEQQVVHSPVHAVVAAQQGQQQRHPLATGWYWSNRFRFRFWWFLLTAPFVASLLLGLINPAMVYSYFLWLPLTVFVFLRTQMACRHCGARLAANNIIGGDPNICKRCNAPTDAGLRVGYTG